MKIIKCYKCGVPRPDKDIAWYRGAVGVCKECVRNMTDQEFKDLLVAEAVKDNDTKALQAFEKMGFKKECKSCKYYCPVDIGYPPECIFPFLVPSEEVLADPPECLSAEDIARFFDCDLH